MNLTTFTVTYHTGYGETEEITLTGIADMQVMRGDIVVFLDGEGDAVFGLHSSKLISFERSE